VAGQGGRAVARGRAPPPALEPAAVRAGRAPRLRRLLRRAQRAVPALAGAAGRAPPGALGRTARRGGDGGPGRLLRPARSRGADARRVPAAGRGRGDVALGDGDPRGVDRDRGVAGRARPPRPSSGVSARSRAALGTLALALGSLLLVALSLEAALRLARYQPERFRNTARVVDPKWRVLLDCYPTNPRGYFDIDLRDEATRERYRWMAPIRLD